MAGKNLLITWILYLPCICLISSHSHGQGHEITFAQVVADKLCISMDDVEISHGDTESVAFGMGTYVSRSISVGGVDIVTVHKKIQ